MKAILVVDMPVNCSECPCFYDYLYCQAKAGVNVLGDERPKECPLRPMPKKINVENIKDTIHTEFQTPGAIYDKFVAKIQLDTDKLIAIGYNMCVDEILGETE